MVRATLPLCLYTLGHNTFRRLMFVPSDKVDFIWRKIASKPIFSTSIVCLNQVRLASLVSGPLSTTPAWLAKVATSPEGEVPNYQHLICVYIPDVYNKETVIEVPFCFLLQFIQASTPFVGYESPSPQSWRFTLRCQVWSIHRYWSVVCYSVFFVSVMQTHFLSRYWQ